MTGDVDRRLQVTAAAREAPRRPAIIEGPRTVPYAELAHLVARAAGGLRAAGAHPGRPMAMGATGRLPFLVCLHALVRLGVPVAPLHPRLRPDERAAVLDALGVSAVLDPADQDALLDAAPASADAGPIDPEHPLALVATSGSTGRPKGVILPRRAFVAAFDMASANLGWRDGDRWLLCLPPAHVGGLSIPIRTLLARRTTVCAPPGPFDPGVLARTLEDHRVTHLSLVPTQLARLLDLDWRPPPTLRALLLGGAGASPALLARAHERGAPVLTTYGLTETCGQVTTQRPGTAPGREQGAGPALPGARVRIVDGEIQVRTPALLSGYVGSNAPSLTRDGYLRTGDAGVLDGAGRLHVLGRLDDRIVTGGENVDPSEVEPALERLPGIQAACVFGVPDALWGQTVAAAVVVGEGGDPLPGLGARLAEVLAPHRRPRWVAVVEDLPTTASGKVDRRAVAAAVRPHLRPV
jgi:o-succinylbenzoate---CoA ligase